MARKENKGRQPTPSSTPRGPSYREVTQFRGSDLQEIHQKVVGFTGVEPNTDLSRDEISVGLGLKPKEEVRVNKGLDVINQLSVLGFGPQDIRSVVVYEMLQDQINVGPAAGNHHYHYNITWTNPPVDKPIPQPERPRPQSSDRQTRRKSTNDTSEESFAERKKRERAERRAVRDLEAQQEIRRHERLAVDKVIIDTTAENAQDTIDSGVVFIGTSEEGEGTILFGKFGSNHQVVDREDGSFPDWGEYRSYLKPDYLKFYEGIAREIETGIPSDYKPAPLTPEVCAETYEKALSLRMLNIQQTDDGHQFGYPESPSSLFFDTFQQLFPRFSPVNLDEGVIPVDSRWRPKNRPVHPDFAEFLRQKKTELD